MHYLLSDKRTPSLDAYIDEFGLEKGIKITKNSPSLFTRSAGKAIEAIGLRC